jgi:hypothetical protein
MAKTLAQIQTLVRYNARDDSIDLTTTTNLAIVNETYRELISQLPWPEYLRKAILTSQTVADQEEYQWTGASFPIFLDVNYIEILSLSYDKDTTDSDIFNTNTITSATARYTYKAVWPPPNEWEWNLAGRRTSVDQPLWYKRLNNGTNDVVALRPTPSVTGYNIRVVGVIEPTALTGSSDTTGFISNQADEAFAHLVAANLATRDGFNDIATWNTNKTNSILKGLFQDEQITTEEISG